MTRKVLVILSNRLNRWQKPRFIEVDCDEEGNILKEHPLRSQPREPRYHEVWENDDGKTDFTSCHSFKRKYGHALEKPKGGGAGGGGRAREVQRPKSKGRKKAEGRRPK